ncbi:14318_t:CDS:2 [Entrophospora sp. SA101]|nr:14318_t:CDS:2 [Entrophospora sp. SA101]
MSNSGELDEINETKKRSGRPREEVWEYFEEKGERIKGHCGGVCKFCGWEKRLAQPNDMREHLAFYCKEVPYETRKHYLEVIKNYSILNMANRAIVKFFACCGIPFHILAFITGEINDMLNVETNLTLALDGWTSPSGQSLYAFIIITKDRREIVHSIQNLSKESHTGIFLSEKIIEVIENL